MLQLHGVTKQYGPDGPHALADIDLTVQPGEFLTLIGPSGCGKTTLLRLVAGFETPTRGQILLDGRPLAGPGPDRMVVFQGFDQLFPWLTVRQNVAFALRAVQRRAVPAGGAAGAGGGGGAEAMSDVARQYLRLVGLEPWQELYPHQLSGGMKQRVAIARALSVRPRFLLMDEPFGSLDAMTRNALQGELIRIWQETGVTVLFVTHNIQEAITLGTRIAVMTAGPGRLAAVFPNLLQPPRTPAVSGFGALWKALHELLAAAAGPAAARIGGAAYGDTMAVPS